MSIPFSEGTRRYNIAPTEPVLAVIRSARGEPLARALRWGLIPWWAKDLRGAYKMINARAETTAARPAYRELIGRAERRALLPADGFYEWLRSEDRRLPRQPFRFTVDDGAPFAIAGLWTHARIGGEQIASVTILTCAANSAVGPLHDRMPVILPDRDSELAWLDPSLGTPQELCLPLAAARMQVAPANPAVNKAGISESPELLVAPGRMYESGGATLA